MKTTLLLCSSVLLFYSCVQAYGSGSEEMISDDEMKNRVEVEEIEFNVENPLKDAMMVAELAIEDRNSVLGIMKNEVLMEFPSPEKKEVVINRIYEPRQRVTVRQPPIIFALNRVEDSIVDFPDIEAQFPGGVREMKAFIVDNLKYPDPIGCYQGRVYVAFIVEKDGGITHAEVMIGGISKELNEEALRVVRAMPNWIPARQNGKIVATRARLPISFTLN